MLISPTKYTITTSVGNNQTQEQSVPKSTKFGTLRPNAEYACFFDKCPFYRNRISMGSKTK